MKRGLITAGLSLMLLLGLTTPALAADAAIGVTEDGKGGYNVSVTGTDITASDQYVLLILKAGKTPENMEVGDILYIDQAAGSDLGAAFDGLQLKSKLSADIYVGGTNLEKPVASLRSNEGGIYVAGVPVTGTVALQGRESGKLDGVSVKLTNVDDPLSSFTAESDASGKYDLGTVPAGTYKLELSRPSYLGYSKRTLEIADETAIPRTTLKGGEIVVDGQVTIRDLTALLGKYSEVTSGTEDINGDGQITIKDLTILLANYGDIKTED